METRTSKNLLSSPPLEILIEILCYLPIEFLALNIAVLSWQYKHAFDSPLLWKRKLSHHFPRLFTPPASYSYQTFIALNNKEYSSFPLEIRKRFVRIKENELTELSHLEIKQRDKLVSWARSSGFQLLLDFCYQLTLDEFKSEMTEASDNEKAYLQKTDACGNTLLHWAVYFLQTVEVIQELIKAGIPINTAAQKSAPLTFAAMAGHHEAVKTLLANEDISVNHVVENNQTPLFVAAHYGHHKVVEIFLTEPRTNVNQQTTGGSTPFFAAIQYKHPEVVKAFLSSSRTDIDLPTKMGTTPLMMASTNGDLDTVRALLTYDSLKINDKDENDTTALFMAAENGHHKIVNELLIKPHLDINLAKKGKVTPLYMAAQKNHLKVVKVLTADPRTNVNIAREVDGATPLLIAVYHGHFKVVEVLLTNATLDVNQANREQITPLFLATLKKHREIVKLLLNDSRINVNPRCDNMTPIFAAAQHGELEMVELFLQKSSIDLTISYKRTSQQLKEFAQKHNVERNMQNFIAEKSNHQDIISITPPEIAAIMGHTQIVGLFAAINNRCLGEESREMNLRM